MCGSSPFKGTGQSESSLAWAQMTAMSSHDAWLARLEKPFATWVCERQCVWLMAGLTVPGLFRSRLYNVKRKLLMSYNWQIGRYHIGGSVGRIPSC
jgi:hypothetical protein